MGYSLKLAKTAQYLGCNRKWQSAGKKALPTGKNMNILLKGATCCRSRHHVLKDHRVTLSVDEIPAILRHSIGSTDVELAGRTKVVWHVCYCLKVILHSVQVYGSFVLTR